MERATGISKLRVSSVAVLAAASLAFTGCGIDGRDIPKRIEYGSKLYFTGFDDATCEEYINIFDKETGFSILCINVDDIKNAIPVDMVSDIGVVIDEKCNPIVIPGNQIPYTDCDYILSNCQVDRDGRVLVGPPDATHWDDSKFSVERVPGYCFKKDGEYYDVFGHYIVDLFNSTAGKKYGIKLEQCPIGAIDHLWFTEEGTDNQGSLSRVIPPKENASDSKSKVKKPENGHSH